jgi:desampylase
MEIALTSWVLAAIIAAARAAHPHEACGILLGENGRITGAVPAANIHPDPATRFEIDPAALIAAYREAREPGAPQVMGYFHSHPEGVPVPSATDQVMAARDGKVWAIVAGDDVRFWTDGEEGFVALSFTLIDG